MKNKVFTFKALLDKEIYRVIEIKGNKSLYDFAAIILKSFDFDMDHAFGFFNNLKNIYKSDEVYELFSDELRSEFKQDSKGVNGVIVADVFELKKKMAFLFDYGDEWIFLVECKKISEALPKTKYPRIIDKVGDAPEQYPDYDEYFEDEDV